MSDAKPGICDCSVRPGLLPYPFCSWCGHPTTNHHDDSGCTDGIDHPGSVGQLEHVADPGPTAEQWARGVAQVVDALHMINKTATAEDRTNFIKTAIHFILTGG